MRMTNVNRIQSIMINQMNKTFTSSTCSYCEVDDLEQKEGNAINRTLSLMTTIVVEQSKF